MRVVGVDHRRAPGDDLADQLRLGPPVPQRDLGGQAVGHAHVGDHGRPERDALEAPRLDGLAGRLDHARVAVHVDHVREDRGQPRRPAGPGPAERAGGFRGGTAGPRPGPDPRAQGRLAMPSDQPRAPIRPHRRPAASRIDRTNRLVTVLPKVPVTPDGREPLGRVAGEGLADPRMGRAGVVDDHLEPAGLGAGVLQHHARGAPVERLAHEGVAVVARVADRDEHLARVEPAMVVGAAGDLPVGAAHEPGLGEQPPEAHRGDPLLRQTVSEPACHRHTPPCFASQPCSVSFPRPRASPGPRRQSFSAGRREPRAPGNPASVPRAGISGAGRLASSPVRHAGRCRSRPDLRFPIDFSSCSSRVWSGRGWVCRLAEVCCVQVAAFSPNRGKRQSQRPPRPIIESLTARL